MPRLPVTACLKIAACIAVLTCGAARAADESQLGLKPGLWQVEITYQSINGRQVLDNHYLLARLLNSIDPTDLALDRVNVALAQTGDSGFAGQLQRANFARSNVMPEGGLPNDMRMKAEASTNENGADMGATASFHICLTPAMARLDAPILDDANRCRATHIVRQGKHADFEFGCAANGTSITGHGESHRAMFGSITTVADLKAVLNGKAPLAVHNRMQMKFLGAACGALKPPTP